MTRPRIFVSSTYYDLRHIRQGISQFIDSLGYDAILFESGDIPFSHEDALEESCYREIQNCHILVLIIGGRYGSPSRRDDDRHIDNDSGDRDQYNLYNSITQREYETAIEHDLPVYTFVESGVLSEYKTFRKNRENKHINYAHVDSVNIFLLLDSMYLKSKNNLVCPFDSLGDICEFLRDQWAGLFAEQLKSRAHARTLLSLSSQLSQLAGVADVLKEYSETIMSGVVPEMAKKIIEEADATLSRRELAAHVESQTYLAHLIQSCGVPAASILDAIGDASTFHQAGEALSRLVVAAQRAASTEMLAYGFWVQLNSVREAMNLEAFRIPPKIRDDANARIRLGAGGPKLL